MIEVTHKNTAPAWESNVDEFCRICADIIRPGFDKFISMLVNHTDFLSAPASTRFHSCFKGGLLHHSLIVHRRLVNLMISEWKNNGAFDNISQENFRNANESIAIVALFHDICKANSYVMSTRNVKNTEGNWEAVPFYEYSPKLPFGHAEKSIIILEKYITLTTEEAAAILCHMGDYTVQKDMSRVFNEYPLAVNLHVADLQATYIDEATIPATVASNKRDEAKIDVFRTAMGKYKKTEPANTAE